MRRYLAHGDFGDKQKMRRVIASPLTILALLVLIGIAGWKTYDMYRKWQQSEAALATAQAAYDNLEKREEFLDAKIESLSSDIGVEAEVRERFGVAKQGEGVIVVLSDEEEHDPLPPETGFWSRVKAIFRND